MNALTHDEVRELLHIALDTGLKSGDRRAVEAHLADCPPCAAYANDLARLDAHLFEAMQARWADPDLPSLELDRGLRLIEVRMRQRQARNRLLSVAQPAVWTAGAVALVAVLGWLFGVVRPDTTQQPEETSTIDAEAAAAASETYLAEMALTSLPEEATPTPTALSGPLDCMVEVTGDDVSLHEGPGDEFATTRVIETGMMGLVLYVAYPGTNSPWLMVQFEEPQAEPPNYTGWLPAADVTASGDCGGVPEYQPGDEVAEAQPIPTWPPPPTYTPTPTWVPTMSATPDSNRVCYIAPGEYGPPDQTVYSGPGRTYTAVGSLEIGEYVLATGIFSQEGYGTWTMIEHEGITGWVDATFYMFDDRGTMGCWPIPPVDVNPPPPTYTPTPTLEGGLPSPILQQPSLTPTSTLLPSIDFRDVLYIGGDAGYQYQMARTLPLANGAAQHEIAIRIGVPPGEERWLNVTVSCSNPGLIQWGPYAEGDPNLNCGNWYGMRMSQGNNLMVLTISLAPGVSDSVIYTLLASVGE